MRLFRSEDAVVERLILSVVRYRGIAHCALRAVSSGSHRSVAEG